MERQRCGWAKTEQSIVYHDSEWGVAVWDERMLFEFLILEGAQAGLSWETILSKRENYRAAFAGFEMEKVAGFSEKQVEKLLLNPGIVRNRLKVQSAVSNARAALELRQRTGRSLADFLWDFVEGKPVVNQWEALSQVPAHSEVSDAMSKTLKRHGFRFVGSTICYAFMQATGMMNDHLVSCFRHAEVGRIRARASSPAGAGARANARGRRR
jgi:DNA-3-methyladenine glycosylase I